MTLFDIYSCPKCGAMNSSTKNFEVVKKYPTHLKCFNCTEINPKSTFQFVQGKSHDEKLTGHDLHWDD